MLFMKLLLPLFALNLINLPIANGAEDFYNLLGVSKDATKAQIRRAFKKIAIEKHPDKNPNDPGAHETFTKINRAYETLKDDDLRKKYDTYGEEGLKDDHFSNQYQSWNFYNEQFGIYDDDPEIITLSKADFEQSVSGTEDVWFINFYSPHCSHCHTLAPVWREVARELNGVIRMGAVNCHDDWMLCRMQGINGYPSLRIYPTGEYYYGEHEKEKMISHIMSNLEVDVIDLTLTMIKEVMPTSERPWLIAFCDDETLIHCMEDRMLIKLSAMLENLVHVARANCLNDKKLCMAFDTSTSLRLVKIKDQKCQPALLIPATNAIDILEEVLKLLPEPVTVNDEMFQGIRRKVAEGEEESWLLIFREDFDDKDLELRKMAGLLPYQKIGQVNCKDEHDLCSRFYLSKFPTVLFYKSIGYEVHHGRYNAHDITNFVRESDLSNVRVLHPENFPNLKEIKDNWFIDFFAPWCPPCMKLLPEWRKAGKQIGDSIAKFGTVDCTIHKDLCLKQNVRSYPTTIFFNKTEEAHIYSGYHSAEDIIAFAEDILKPPVIVLTPESFEKSINQKELGETWVVDFYAPWCGPCMELAPTYRQLAKRLYGEATLATIDCQKYSYFCNTQNINTYPTIRLYSYQSKDASHYARHQGWRDLESLYTWVFQHFPSLVAEADYQTFYDEILNSNDAYLIDFYTSWCGHCHTFAPHYSKLAKRLEGRVKAVKINCETEYVVCRSVGVRSYPTVVFFPGVLYKGMSQAVTGVHLNSLDTGYLHDTALHMLANHQRDLERVEKEESGETMTFSSTTTQPPPPTTPIQDEDDESGYQTFDVHMSGDEDDEQSYYMHYEHDEF